MENENTILFIFLFIFSISALILSFTSIYYPIYDNVYHKNCLYNNSLCSIASYFHLMALIFGIFACGILFGYIFMVFDAKNNRHNLKQLNKNFDEYSSTNIFVILTCFAFVFQFISLILNTVYYLNETNEQVPVGNEIILEGTSVVLYFLILLIIFSVFMSK